MARTRRGAAPYSAQLKKFLSSAEDLTATFSAATLEKVFDPKPNENRRTTINKIHQELRKAWQEGDIIAFVASDGTELCESEFCINGSGAVQHPQIYGLPGASSPKPGYAPTTYAEAMRLRTEGHSNHESGNGAGPMGDEPASSVTEAAEQGASSTAVAEADIEPTEPPDDGTDDDRAAAEDLAEAARRYEVSGPAPKWLPDRLMTHFVMLPKAVVCWRDGLDRASKGERLQLIRAGVRRKGPIDALTATRMASLCRSEQAWWSRAFHAAVSQYVEWDEWIEEEDLGALRRAPDEFLLEHDERYHPAAIVLCGLSLGAEAESLTLVAEEAATLLDKEEGQQTITPQEELRHRAAALEAEVAELRRQLQEEQNEAEAQRRAVERLTAALRERDSAADAGAQLAEVKNKNRDLVAENAKLQTRLEVAEEQAQERDELREQIAQLEQQRDELAVRAATSENERALREQAEARLQEQIAETRRLERELQDGGGMRVPAEDAPALVQAVAGPIAGATGHAAQRLAAGRALPDDPRLLQFAAAFSDLAASVTHSEAAPSEPAPLALPPTDEGPPPEASSESSTVVDDEVTEASVAVAPEEVCEDRDGVVSSPTRPGAVEEASPRPQTRRRSRRAAAFTIHPFGGAGEVGGSAILLETRSGHAVLLDAGQRVKGEYGIDTRSPFHYSLPPFDQLDAIVISHAHIDHIGSLPVLYREYQRHRNDQLPVLMSEPTRRVGEIMLRDSAKIQHKREYLTSGAFADLATSDFAPQLDLKPAYGPAEITEALEAVQVLEPRQPFLIPGTSLTVKLLPVAHVLGSCAVHLTDNETGATLLYTGDLGPLTETQRTLPDFDGVNGFDPADVVIMESTYALPSENERAGRRGATRENSLQALYRAARKAKDAGGHVLLPAFSLGRTQELLRVIEDAVATGDMPAGEVYVGGMGEQISYVYSQYTGSMWVSSGRMRGASEMNRWVRDGIEFDDAVEDAVGMQSFSYFICSPAMLSGGWSRAFLRRMVDEERHAIVFTGYLPRHGGAIRNLSKLYTGASIPLEGRNERTVKIRCDWVKAPLSAHAPRTDLIAFAQRMLLGERQVSFGVLHGMTEAQESLAAGINELEGATAQSLSNGVPWKPHLS